jgi:hypothetical protein
VAAPATSLTVRDSAEAVQILRDNADALVERAVQAVIDDQEAVTNSPLGAVTVRHVRLAARYALDCFLQRVDGTLDEVDLAPFVLQGRLQHAAGRSLTELMGFYRLGGPAMWRLAIRMPELRRADPEILLLLGSEATALSQQFSVASLEGYMAEEQETRRRARDRRERLLALLLAKDPADPAALQSAALEAGWPLPDLLRVAIGERSRDGAERSDPPDRVLVDEYPLSRRLRFVVADEEWEGWLERARGAIGCGPPLVVGPAVPPTRAVISARRAESLWELIQRGLVNDGPLVRCDDHELAMLLGTDPGLAEEFAARRLSALDHLAPAAHSRALATLREWLAHRGSPTAVGDALGIHTQTVRYRIDRLRRLLGDELDDPKARFELELAVWIAQTIGLHPGGSGS